MSDIFISYTREDQKTAQQLARALEAQGWSVWWDTHLNAGEVWDEVIERELRAARCVIVLWSKASVENNRVQEEAGEGLERRILAPIKIENVQPPLPFVGIQTVNLIDWKGHWEHPGFEQLRESVKHLLRAPPKIFISYSHDTIEHQERVLGLADQLRAQGVDAEVDQYHIAPPENWPLWCERQIEAAVVVLMVCTETYYRRVSGNEEPGKGLGVVWEAQIIRQHLYEAAAVNNKFVPVLFSDALPEHIPIPIRGGARYIVDTEDGYEELYRRLTNQPRQVRPKLGPIRPLPPKDRQWQEKPKETTPGPFPPPLILDPHMSKESASEQTKTTVNVQNTNSKLKRLVTSITLLLLITTPLVLLIISWNHPLWKIFPPKDPVVTDHPQDAVIADPPPVDLPVKPSLKSYGNRNNNDTAVRIEAATSERFEIDTGINIESHHPTEEGRLSALIEAWNPPPGESPSREYDAVMIDIIWAAELAPHLIDLGPFFNKEIESHNEVIINNNTVNGHLIAVPWFQNIGVLFYRKDLLWESGRGVPETWEDLEEAAVKIQAKQRREKNDLEFIGFAWQGARYEGLTCNALEWIASEGAYDLEKNEILFDNKEGLLNALDRARGWVKGENAISSYVQTYMEEEALQKFLTGKAAFLRGWSNEYALLKQSGIEFDVAPLPLPQGSVEKNVSVLGGWQLAVPKYSLNQRSAIEFIRYLSSPKVQKWRAEVGAYQPTIKTVDVQEALPFMKEDWFRDIQLIIRPSNRLGNRYNKASECIYTSVYSALNRNSEGEIQQDINEMENCIERESKIP